ncbi:uncharacterized protein EI90DRAFT_3073181 [Cantharellus anzutake]|uniref:uncharacterized protein n=1 Tax=Cantharellus anzutake TaxID=1750568 RepID=UPI0019082001|nr:uncharacterized protein EI90DRAFT_3073181 [Cantharellus anzutake]KAF8325169.1 hypothetical protein EI90DRAFT_3073181 [Cantharellus anzutake]
MTAQPSGSSFQPTRGQPRRASVGAGQRPDSCSVAASPSARLDPQDAINVKRYPSDSEGVGDDGGDSVESEGPTREQGSIEDHRAHGMCATAPLQGDEEPSDPMQHAQETDIIRDVPHLWSATLTLIDFCANLPMSEEANHSKVISVTRWVTSKGIPHRFLILDVFDSARGRHLFFRLDRRRDQNESSISSSRPSHAIDGVHTSGKLDCLLDRRSVRKEAELNLRIQASLLEVGLILQAVIDVCPQYRLFQEDCWFFVSIVQEILQTNYSGEYEMGGLNDGRRKRDVRERIWQRLEQLKSDGSEVVASRV